MNWSFRYLPWLWQYQTGIFVMLKQCYYGANTGLFHEILSITCIVIKYTYLCLHIFIIVYVPSASCFSGNVYKLMILFSKEKFKRLFLCCVSIVSFIFPLPSPCFSKSFTACLNDAMPSKVFYLLSQIFLEQIVLG